MADDLKTWMESGCHLPPFMRDFHDQKDLFKTLQEVVERRAASGDTYIKDVTWIAAHVYTVDVFLWIMAKHGYTLQRSRRRFAFQDIGETVAAAMARWREQSSALMRAVLGGP